MFKIITLAPETVIDQIIKAMTQAGAGKIGDYSHYAFITRGQGNWLPFP